MKLLKADMVQEVLEAAYAAENPDFHCLVECYAAGKTDEGIGDLIRQVYEFAMSYPWPLETLEQWQRVYEADSIEEIADSRWMQALMEDAAKKIRAAVELSEEAWELSESVGGPYMYLDALESDRELLDRLQAAETFNGYVQELSGLSFAALSRKKDSQVDPQLREQVKNIREQVQDIL